MGTPSAAGAGYAPGVAARARVNALIPFSTRLGDDGLVHVRAWDTPDGPSALVAELDWAVMVADRGDAYFGPGVFTYPGYALDAAREAWWRAGLDDPVVVVRLPDPPGERFARVTDPADPEGWEPVPPEHLASVLGGVDWSGPPPGAYVRRVVEYWTRTGGLPA